MSASQATKRLLKSLIKPKGKTAFLDLLRDDCRILDVGCGNDSPLHFKARFPNSHYTGVDVGDYNHSQPILADRYIVVAPEEFSGAIGQFDSEFDAAISSHNLEHCDDRTATLQAMLRAVKPGGYLYLSFPAEHTVKLPKREGTLNYYDDPTHQGSPPDFAAIVDAIRELGYDILVSKPHYRPLLLATLGFLTEPLARMRGRVLSGTWAYYGFESIIWARRQQPGTA